MNISQRVYIAGPINGVEDYLEIFAKAEKELLDAGFSVVNPAKIEAEMPQDTKYTDYIDMSLAMLKTCNIIYMLPGWFNSNGAKLEYAYAIAMGMKAYENIDKLIMHDSE
jgi:nucleoside 2-deoxyribosyltransferase